MGKNFLNEIIKNNSLKFSGYSATNVLFRYICSNTPMIMSKINPGINVCIIIYRNNINAHYLKTEYILLEHVYDEICRHQKE